MSYRKMARVSKAETTRFGGPAVGVVAQPSVPEVAEVKPEYLSMAVYGFCSGCGATSEDMESDGWITPDDYVTYLCPTCQYKGKCTHCGLTLMVQKVHAGSQYDGMYQVGQHIAQCTNPDCGARGHIFRVKVLDLTP